MRWSAQRGGDPRAGDVGVVDALLEHVAAVSPGTVRLPAMTAAELCVLGAMSSTLIDITAWSWWASAPVARRPALQAAAWRILSYRGLAGEVDRGRPGQTGEVRVAPVAALIVAARVRPAFVVLCRSGTGSELEPTRMFGLADGGRGVRAVLIEEAKRGQAGWAGPAYEYRLAAAAAAGRVLARWALDLSSARAGTGWPRLVDVHLPGTGDTRPGRRITVQADGGEFRALAEPPWLPVTNRLPCDEEVLTSLLTDTLTGVCP